MKTLCKRNYSILLLFVATEKKSCKKREQIKGRNSKRSEWKYKTSELSYGRIKLIKGKQYEV